MRSALVGCASAVLAGATLGAQGKVWVVDQGLGPGFDTASLPSAISSAAAGDTILVRTGIYSGFALLGKDFAVIAEAGATVVVQPPVNFPSTVENVPQGQTLILRGLDLEGFSVGDSNGLIWLEDCRMRSMSFGVPAFSSVLCDNVVLQRCAMVGIPGIDCSGGCLFPPGEGLHVTDSNVFLERCTMQGGAGLDASSIFLSVGQAAAPGGYVNAGRLWAAECSFVGGVGGAGFDDTGGGGTCASAGPGGPGLELQNVAAFGKQIALTGGVGGAPAGCSGSLPGAPGPALFTAGGTATVLPGTTRGFEVGSPLREGETLVAVVDGPPGEIAVVALSTRPAANLQTALGGAFYLDVPFTIQATGVIGPGGTATFQAPVSPMDPSLEFAHVWLQAATCGPATCTLAGGSVVTVLDAQF